MPKRLYIRTYNTEEVQGEGSFVKLRDRSYGKSKEIAAQVANMTDEEKAESVLQDMRDRILEWNWVDDDGQPLPLPSEDPDLFDRLYEQEVQLLTKVIRGQVELANRKSSES